MESDSVGSSFSSFTHFRSAFTSFGNLSQFQFYNRDASRGLCRMKMLPVMILANYHSSARSAVSERPNSSARLVSQCPNMLHLSVNDPSVCSY